MGVQVVRGNFLRASKGLLLAPGNAFPGVGLGGLEEGEVLEVLEPLLGGFQVYLYKL
jgi:hypothetical protein